MMEPPSGENSTRTFYRVSHVQNEGAWDGAECLKSDSGTQSIVFCYLIDLFERLITNVDLFLSG